MAIVPSHFLYPEETTMKKVLSAVALGAVAVSLVCSARSKTNAPATSKVRKGRLTLISKDLGKTLAQVTVDYRLTNSGISYNIDAVESELSTRAKSLLSNFSGYVEKEIKNPTYGTFSLENACSSFMADFPSLSAYLD